MEEKNQKPILSYRSALPADRKIHFGFCMFLKGFGASFYTMRDRIVYGTTPFSEWELHGIDGMIRRFKPEYKGLLCDFFDRISREERSRFVSFMVKDGGMSKTTCYSRFRTFNFAPWEMRGILALERMYLKSEAYVSEINRG